ncbi:hypothetical protein [Puia dinghuensis]|nr:hypothetical protein [Puia dinghuensis]
MNSENDHASEDLSGYLLSEQKRRDLHYHNSICRDTIQRLSGEWQIIGKYYQRLWFQRTFRMTEEELLARYRDLAYHLTWAEKDIEINNRALYMHTVAVEALHRDMTPYNKLNMSQHILIQQQLFQ